MAKSSKIPGYEQLTRPEEISALSKYLKAKREDLDSKTELGEDNLEVPGRKTGKIPQIDRLPDSYENLKVSKDTKLSNTKINLENQENLSLSNVRLNVMDNEKEDIGTLDSSRVGLLSSSKKDINSLETKAEKLESDEKSVELGNKRAELENPDKDLKLSESKEKLRDTKNNLGLSGKREKLISSKTGNPEGLYGSVLGAPENQSGEPEELYDSVLTPDIEPEDKIEGLENDIIKPDIEPEKDSRLEEGNSERIPGTKKEDIDSLESSRLDIEPEDKIEGLENDIIKGPSELDVELEDFIDIIKNSDKDISLYDKLINLLDSNGNDISEWEEKIKALVSTYLSDDNKISPEKAVEYEAKLENTLKVLSISGSNTLKDLPDPKNRAYLEDILGLSKWLVKKGNSERIPGTKLPSGSSIVSYGNVNNYLRWLAEQTATVGGVANPVFGGKTKEFLIEETIAALVIGRDKLERLSKTNRDRLPGDDNWVISSLVQGGVSGLIDSSLNKGKQVLKDFAGKILKSGETGPKPSYNRPKAGQVGENKEYSFSGADESGTIIFKDSYGSGEGIKTTLKDLCGYSGEAESLAKVVSELTKEGSLITTWSKEDSLKLTLDSNSFWEVIIEPYCGKLNGGISYLPAIQEINAINSKTHGVKTRYNKWIPFSSFELSKSKVNTKSVGLYDGEIVFPVSMEFTNEFRLNIIDDQYKSWRTYFQRCADAAIYNSEPHGSNYYSSPGEYITGIDKTNIFPAFYQNITFRIRVYIMTPQFSTIRKFDLLCVLRDFIEEFSGDIDAGAGDLSVAFSIVGENPTDSETPEIKAPFDTTRNPMLSSALGVLSNAPSLTGGGIIGRI